MTARSDYQRYLASEAWQEKRREALRIHGHKCQRCGSDFRLEVHHKSYESGWGNENVESDLEVLCPSCHRQEHFGHLPVVKVDSSWRKENGVSLERWPNKEKQKKKRRSKKIAHEIAMGEKKRKKKQLRKAKKLSLCA